MKKLAKDILDFDWDITFPSMIAEKRLLRKVKYCSDSEKVYVNLQEITSAIHDEEYSNDFMKDLLCVTGSTLRLDSNVPESTISKILDKISIRSLSIPTTAEVYKGSVGTTEPFVIKTSIEFEKSIIHEAFVGLYITNTFRQSVPNFAYILGYFQCSPPILNNNEVVAWCSHNVKNPYVIYEAIEGSTLESMLPNLTFSEFVEVYMQIFYALWQFQDKFSHFDLKPDNIILRPLDERMTIKYETPNGERFVVSKYVATMIDYGLSTVVYQKKVYSAFVDEKNKPFNTNIAADLFRLAFYTCYWGEYSMSSNIRIFAEDIADFFVDYPESEIDNILGKYGILPQIELIVQDFESFLFNLLEGYDFVNKPEEILLNHLSKFNTNSTLLNEILSYELKDPIFSSNPTRIYHENISILIQATVISQKVQKLYYKTKKLPNELNEINQYLRKIKDFTKYLMDLQLKKEEYKTLLKIYLSL